VQDHPTLCGNCGTTKPDNATWTVVIDWRRDELCGKCFASFTWSELDWHKPSATLCVRRGALEPGTSVTSHGQFYDLAGVVEAHYGNGITRLTCRKANGHRYSVDVGTITLSPQVTA
jgi:hypothetical protein